MPANERDGSRWYPIPTRYDDEDIEVQFDESYDNRELAIRFIARDSFAALEMVQLNKRQAIVLRDLLTHFIDTKEWT